MQAPFESAFRPATVLTTVAALMVLLPFPGTHAQGLEDPLPDPLRKSTLTLALETVVDGLTAPLWGTAPRGRTQVRSHLRLGRSGCEQDRHSPTRDPGGDPSERSSVVAHRAHLGGREPPASPLRNRLEWRESGGGAASHP